MPPNRENVPIIGTLSKSSDAILTAMQISIERYGFASLDCAPRYGNLEQVAVAVHQLSLNRESVRITSKINTSRQEQSTVNQSVLEDIKDIGVDYLDCYLIHSPRYHNFSSTWLDMLDVQKGGLIKEIGVANFGFEELALLPHPYPTVVQVSAPQYYSGHCPQPLSSLRVEVYGLISFFLRLPDHSKATFLSLCSEMGLKVDEGILVSSAYEGVIPVLGTSKQDRLERQLNAYEYGFAQPKQGAALSECLRSLYA